MRTVFVLAIAAVSLVHNVESFAPMLVPVLRSSTTAAAPLRPVRFRHTAARFCMTASTKESPLEDGGSRGLEEEERRVSLWKGKYQLSDATVEVLRSEFEKAVEKSDSKLRTISKEQLRRVIESASSGIDLADVHQGDTAEEGRPEVTEDELNNYVTALGGQWAEACDVDAVEVANGECQTDMDTVNFDLPETLAVFGMCLTNHCGIGGVCFWDSS